MIRRVLVAIYIYLSGPIRILVKPTEEPSSNWPTQSSGAPWVQIFHYLYGDGDNRAADCLSAGANGLRRRL